MNKLKGWTAVLAVKIISFILILVCCYGIIGCVYEIEAYNSKSGISIDVVLADLSTNRYFYDRHMYMVEEYAFTAARYMSENLIQQGKYLEWIEHNDGCSLETPDGSRQYAWIDYDIVYTMSEKILTDDRDNMIYGYGEDSYGNNYRITFDTETGEYSYETIGVIPRAEVYYNPKTDEYYDEFGNWIPREQVFYFDSGIVNVRTDVISIEKPSDLPWQREEAEKNAIAAQLDEFRRALDGLQNTDGLIYHISNSSDRLPGNAGASSDHFRSQPVYIITDADTRWEVSENDATYSRFNLMNDYVLNMYLPGYQDIEATTVYLAFTHEYVNAQNAFYRNAQALYVRYLVQAGIMILLGLVFFVILLAGAGRKRIVVRGQDSGVSSRDSDDIGVLLASPIDENPAPATVPKGEVHFNLLDKPFVDITLLIAAAWVVSMSVLAIEIYEQLDWYKNYHLMQPLFAAYATLTVSPVLFWCMSAVKRIKAGKFRKHTLIYFIPSRIWRLVKSFVLYLAGLSLPIALRIVFVTIGVFFILLVAAVFGFSNYAWFSLFYISAVTVLVSVIYCFYAMRLSKLKAGAQAISEGNYDTLIDVKGGVFGKIADSLQNISNGINTAVDERMKSERLKTELITNVSHDIRTPLTSIITYTDLLKNEGLDCKEAPEYLDILAQKANRLKSLTDDLFEASKAATGNIDVNLTELDISSLINQVLGEMDSALKASSLDMKLNLPEKLMVKADGKLMWRILENLLANALKYSIPNSRVYVDVSEESGGLNNGGSARIAIKNVSAQELNFDPAELTERFKRGDESRADGGSGLGLSIVQSFVAAQGGTLDISIDGDLFKVSVLLPVAQD